MKYPTALGAGIFIVVAAVAAGQASALTLFDVIWVQSKGQQCNVACRDHDGRLPVDATGSNGTTVNTCRAHHGPWPTIGYNQSTRCMTIKGDGKTPGIVEKAYECLCGRVQ